MQISGAIFDMDGTLLDSMPMWDTAADTLLQAYGKALRPEDAPKMLGMTVGQTVAMLKTEYDLPDTVEELEQRVNEQVREYYYNHCVLKPGAEDFLKALQRRGVPMAVATATHKELVLGALEHVRVVPYFAAITTCGEVGIGKQSPRVYQAAQELLGADPETAWVFEDTLRTVTTAHEAGFKVAAIADNASKADWDTMRTRCDVFLNSWEEALKYFGLV